MASVLDSLERIYAKCEPEPREDGREGFCMLWTGGMSSGGGRGGIGRRYPVAQARDETKASGQRQVHVRRRVWELSRSQPAKAGPRWVLVATCGHERCVAEDCLKLLAKGARLRQAVAKDGAFKSIAFRAKVAEGRRRESKLTDEAVAELQAGAEPLRVLASRHGISLGYAYAVWRGEHRVDYRSPLAALLPISRRAQP